MKKLIMELVSSVLDSVVIYAIWLGNNGYPGIGNIVKVIYWVVALGIAPLALIGVMVAEVDTITQRKSSKLRRSFAMLADILAIGVFAYYGQFVMVGVATVGMLQMVLVWGIVDYRIDKAKGTK